MNVRLVSLAVLAAALAAAVPARAVPCFATDGDDVYDEDGLANGVIIITAASTSAVPPAATNLRLHGARSRRAGGGRRGTDGLSTRGRALEAAQGREARAGCKYRKGSVVATVLIKPGKVLKVIAKAPGLGIPLGIDPRPVAVELRHGAVRHCFVSAA